MKHIIPIVCLSILLWACGTQSASDVMEPKQASFTESYLPAVFLDDQRTKRIEEIAPIIQDMVENYAVEQHIPGMAYGIVVDDNLVIASATGLINLERNTSHSKILF